MSPTLSFPENFVFGVATSSYQVEGGIENDWAEWERQGKLKDPKVRCGDGCGHWDKFYDDIQLIQALGATAYRLSIEWARVEPKRGTWDDRALAGYRERLLALKKAGIRPVVTLHHFTHPQWFHDQTPWHEPSSLESWTRYAKKCAELLEGTGAAVVTFNEPNIFILSGYLGAAFPPGIMDGGKAFAATTNIVRAHVIARQALLERWGGRPLDIGLAQHVTVFAPHRKWWPFDQALTRLGETIFNHGFIEALHTGKVAMNFPGLIAGRDRIDGAEKSMSFLGINYYTRTHVQFLAGPPFATFGFRDAHSRGLTDIGWEYYPEGFGWVLKQMKRYGLPVWVTENGLDDRTGKRRPKFIYDHLKELLLARAEGVDVTTYLHWSLMDNFEWLEGWGPRFGLYEVDLKTQARRPTPAVSYFRKITKSRELVPPDEKEPEAK